MNPRNHSILLLQLQVVAGDAAVWSFQAWGAEREGVPEHHIHIVFLDCFSDILDGGFRQIQVGVIANMKQQEKKS